MRLRVSVLALLVLAAPLAAQDRPAVSFEQLTVGSTAVGLARATTLPSGKPTAVYCRGVVEDAAIRVRVDGSAATSTSGTRADAGSSIELVGADSIRQFSAIRLSSTSGQIGMTCYGRQPDEWRGGLQVTQRVVPPAQGGLGGIFTDPGGDRLLGWDDSADRHMYFTLGDGLLVSGTEITATVAVAAAAQPWHNVLTYGAEGDSHHADGGGTDDTAAIQEAYDEAAANGGYAAVVFPGGRTYRISDTIDVAPGVFTIGMGGMARNGVWSPPIIVWDGADNGIMFNVDTTSTNTPGTYFENINFYGATVGIVNKPLTAVKFTGSSGGVARLDDRTGFRNVSIQGMSGNAIHLTGGATNFFIEGGRFDTNLGYAIYVDLDGSGRSFNAEIYGNVNWVGGSRGQGDGFLFLDGEDAEDGTQTFVTISNLHTEVNQVLDETFAAGALPSDKRGIIRLGVKPANAIMQHHLSIAGWKNSFASVASFSAIQVTSTTGTETTASECISVDIRKGHALHQFVTGDSEVNQEVRLIGGMVPAARRYPYKSFEHVNLTWAYGKDATHASVRGMTMMRHGAHTFRGLTMLPETVAALDSFPATGGMAYVNDALDPDVGETAVGGGAEKAVVFNNGTVWKIIAVVE